MANVQRVAPGAPRRGESLSLVQPNDCRHHPRFARVHVFAPGSPEAFDRSRQGLGVGLLDILSRDSAGCVRLGADCHGWHPKRQHLQSSGRCRGDEPVVEIVAEVTLSRQALDRDSTAAVGMRAFGPETLGADVARQARFVCGPVRRLVREGAAPLVERVG